MTATEKRAEAVRLMKSRAGRNTYTNGGDRGKFFGAPEGADGYSDCSSAVRACIERAAGIDIGRNTDAQIQKLLAGSGKLVDAGSLANPVPDESVLLPGDCIYFKGNKRHTRAVGHVEMYTGPNECWGHGSGQGPTNKDLRKYCLNRAKTAATRYLCTVRWIVDDPAPSLDDYRTIEGEWPVYATLPEEPASIGVIKPGEEVRYYGEKDGYIGVKTASGLKGFIRKEALDDVAEVEQDD